MELVNINKSRNWKMIALTDEQWIYSNEQADALAKKGAKLPLCLQEPVPYHSIKDHMKPILKIEYHMVLRSVDKHWNPLIKNSPSEPRKNKVAIFNLSTEHDILAKKNPCYLGILQSPRNLSLLGSKIENEFPIVLLFC